MRILLDRLPFVASLEQRDDTIGDTNTDAEAASEDLEDGAAITVTNRRIAIKRLPLIRANDQDDKST